MKYTSFVIYASDVAVILFSSNDKLFHYSSSSCFCWFWQLSLCRFGAGYQIVQPMCSMKAIMIMKIQNWTTNHHRFITFSSRSCRIPFVFFLLFLLLC
ncbi:hypothetical protein HanXRQr2_Chr17g0827801 [Helianthus annuus]|uniref:Uncharacterized protein n=1 Tax=Helianthus annuus TaxID=4232 RepID=A0A9K3GW17_HELAN|nr:hypothetical protein HanXRQr2_Chr17g0827801 [Helianthus annuus]KAJ0435942.1 hypothetical protein HanIR_Chr17g0898981 [Helianthus annuus]KAJ0815185.1 hypothetical protein HanPSC8_Chr17g0794661 [Helianthus annuus]